MSAGKINKKINSLKKLLSIKKEKAKEDKLLKDKKQTDEAHSIEISRFNAEWSEQKKKLLENFAAEEEKLKKKFQEDKTKTKEDLKESISSKPKPDPLYLQLKKTKEALIKQKLYDKAYEIEVKIKHLDASKQIK